MSLIMSAIEANADGLIGPTHSYAGEGQGAAIADIADQRATDGGHMNPKLVHPPRLGRQLDHRPVFTRSQGAIAAGGALRARTGVQPAPRTGDPEAFDRLPFVDRPFAGRGDQRRCAQVFRRDRQGQASIRIANETGQAADLADDGRLAAATEGQAH